MKRLLVIHPHSIKKLKKDNLSSFTYYVSFNEDCQTIKNFEKNTDNRIERILIARELEELFFKAQKHFTDRIMGLWEQYGTKEYWWISPLNEKNGWPSEHISTEAIRLWFNQNNKHDKLIFITSNPSFILIKDFLPDYSIEVMGLIHFYIDIFLKYLRVFLEVAYFLYGIIKRKFWIRKIFGYKTTNKTVNNDKIYLVRTYVNESVIHEHENYVDPKFGSLLDYLSKQGYQTVFEPNLSSVNNLKEFLHWCKNNQNDRFVFPEKKLGIKYILKSVYLAFTHLLFYHKIGRDIVLQTRAFNLHIVAFNYWKSSFPFVYKKMGLNIDTVLFSWENKSYEKKMLMIYQKIYDGTKIIGFLSGIPFPTDTTIMLKREIEITPFPDRLVCMSQYVYDIMLKCGIPQEKLKIGPSFRHDYLFQEKHQHSFDNNIIRLLFCFPLNKNLEDELLDMVKEFILLSKNQYEIVLKPHPFSNRAKYNVNSSAKRVIVSAKSMDEELKNAHAVIYTGPTTTACEAVVHGKKVIRFVSQNQFTLDCLYYYEKEHREFSNAIQLLEIIRDLKEERVIVNKLDSIKQYFFEPVLEDNIKVFENIS